nr:MAG TPA: hypothetical protein [Caudoviricetes sp.]
MLQNYVFSCKVDIFADIFMLNFIKSNNLKVYCYFLVTSFSFFGNGSIVLSY